MGIFDFLGFGKKRKAAIADFKSRGAILVDVRTKGEFNGGHAPGSICIPLEQFQNEIKALQKKKKPILLCCATGRRSGVANSILLQKGVESYNAGGWRNLA
jgi:rhodanese-related sulfurtransferase